MRENESILFESDTKEFRLTNFNIRQTVIQFGSSQLTSIELEELTGCEIKRNTYPILLLLSLLGVIVGIDSIGDQYQDIGFFAGIFFLGLYLISTKQMIIFSSPSVQIKLSTHKMKFEKALEFVNEVESAKRRIRTVSARV